ncbi:MAG: SCP2 domain-containing protein [Woeseiaceae bacterium]
MIDLGILFKPLTLLINKRISEQTPARELAESLEGARMAVRVEDTGLAVYMTITDGVLMLHTQYDDEPDVVLSGSPISLAMLAGSDPQGVIRDGHVTMSGDAMIGQRFQQLIQFAKPDLEDELANVVGDVAANQASAIVRGFENAAGQLTDRFHDRFGDYLTKEQGALPSRAQFREFRDDVEKLRDDVARSEARVRLLSAQLAEEE